MILIVDDDEAIRNAIGLMLKIAGMEYTTASNEPDALDHMRNLEPELTILDLNLTPETTGRRGIEMLRKIKILRPEMPVILLTAWGSIPLAVEGMQYGAADFVTKPWHNRDFIAKIRKALRDVAKEATQTQPDTLETVERKAVAEALRRTGGNMTEAARMLGITRQSLYRRMEKYGIK